MKVWQAEVAFGERVVRRVLARDEWANTYPDEAAKWSSTDGAVKGQADVPAPVVEAMAHERDIPNSFLRSGDGTRIFARPRGAEWTIEYTPEQGKPILLTPLDALREFGAESLYAAAEYGYDYRRQVD